jgi:DNA-binding MarR family transcriptional regulator
VDKPKRAIEYAAVADLRYEVRRFLNLAEQASRAAGIQPQQHHALLALRGLPAYTQATVGVLAERMQIPYHTAVRLSRRLAAKGWIRRSRSRTNLRKFLLIVTRRGDKLLENFSRIHRRELQLSGPRLVRALQSAIDHRKKTAH